MFLSLFVCLLATLHKTPERICMRFAGKVGNGPVNKWLNFSGGLDHNLDIGIVFWIRHYWEIWKVVNGHKSATHADSPDGGTDEMCLGRGIQCTVPVLIV